MKLFWIFQKNFVTSPIDLRLSIVHYSLFIIYYEEVFPIFSLMYYAPQ
jgi:hypothetical protein